MNLSSPSTGKVTVHFKGQWFLFEATTTIFVDGYEHSDHSTKKGFTIEVPITNDEMIIETYINGDSTKFCITELDEFSNYQIELFFSRTWGKFSNKFKFS